MDTINLIEHLLLIVNEIVWPAIGLWLLTVARKWMLGKLDVPPHQHTVSMITPERKP